MKKKRYQYVLESGLGTIGFITISFIFGYALYGNRSDAPSWIPKGFFPEDFPEEWWNQIIIKFFFWLFVTNAIIYGIWFLVEFRRLLINRAPKQKNYRIYYRYERYERCRNSKPDD
ncbi:hypothetical protein GCM10011571_17360 [Marinithermofilum abyssi]|jgi:hypothetical protein|uniref:Uncharacterized protein n=1 Tax=Marinithermofilum abyssi TaxID=1571185 RepID=A0A8J2VBX7_9BACL|nr:hypothetical protein [Marinithermofilum abyssi]GGE16222.1 hypothetical protein GCM10011571_17360 [Marinithermofilum abyssi]